MKWSPGPALLAVLMAALPAHGQGFAQDQALRATLVKRPSTNHPLRDFATHLAPGIVPPKGCTRQDFDLAHQMGVAPDLTGCVPSAVEGWIRSLLRMRPIVLPGGPDAENTAIIKQDPHPGQMLKGLETFTLYLAVPTSVQGTGTTDSGQPAAPVTPPGTTAGTPMAATPGTLPPTTTETPAAPTAGTPQPGALNKFAPVGVPLQQPPTGVQTPLTPLPHILFPPEPGSWTQAWNRFWDGLNPLWVAAGVLAGGLGAWRLVNPSRPILTGTPTVHCEVTWARGAAPRWRDDRHVILNAPLIDVELSLGPALITAARILDERLEP